MSALTPICYARPSTQLDAAEPLTQGAQAKEIADISTAAAQVSVRSSQL